MTTLEPKTPEALAAHGFTAVTPFISVLAFDRLIDFAKQAFGAVEEYRTAGKPGDPVDHPFCVMRIDNSMLMFSGGPGSKDREKLHALHLQVPDVDAVYRRALEAGAESLAAPEEKPYGERMAGVKDPLGNTWYIATHHGPLDEGIRAVTPYLHPKNALGLIEFLKQAFGAKELGIYKSPQGQVMHASVRIGDAVLEMGEAEFVPAAFYLHVPDVDATYQRALRAGAKSLSEPADQPYGDRVGGVEDPAGHAWYISTPSRS